MSADPTATIDNELMENETPSDDSVDKPEGKGKGRGKNKSQVTETPRVEEDAVHLGVVRRPNLMRVTFSDNHTQDVNMAVGLAFKRKIGKSRILTPNVRPIAVEEL